jgi:PAS domain S-box-containing protein
MEKRRSRADDPTDNDMDRSQDLSQNLTKVRRDWLMRQRMDIISRCTHIAVFHESDPMNEQHRLRSMAHSLLHAVTEGLNDAVFVKDLQGRYLMINSPGARLLGRSPEEVIGRDDAAFFPPEVARKIKEDDRKVMTEGVMRTFEERIPSEDGETIYQSNKAPYRDRQGQVIGLLGIARDITARKRGEEALRESEERYRDLFENASDIIYSHDLAGNLTSFNKAGEQIFGYNHDEIMRMNIAGLVAPESLQLARSMTAKKLREGGRTIYELVATTKDGRRLVLEISSRLILREGKPIGVQGIARDVTARKQAEEVQRVSQRRKDEFLDLLGHELRNPLAPISSAVRILRRHVENNPTALAMQEMIDRQVRQLARLVGDLLDMSRIHRGLVELRKEPLNLSDIAARAVETTRPIFEERGHRLAVRLPVEPVRLEADPLRIEQMLANLLNNAAKFTEPGGRIWLTVAPKGREAEVRVEDTGIGIRAEEVPRVFDLFTQGEQAPGTVPQGLGIGLTVVKRLAEMQGGTVTVHSAGSGKGSAFVLRLPLLVTEASAVTPTGATAPTLNARSRRVLVVDDNVDAATSLALFLRAEGHAVELAHDGPTAMEVARAQRPELVLLDIGLPKQMDGYEVARRLRKEEGLASCVLAALTGYGQERDRQESRAAGFDHYFVKPVDPSTLLDLISGLPSDA